MSATKKWTWKNGRLHHPTESGISLSTSEAYEMQQNNDDIADACDGVLRNQTRCSEDNEKAVIEELRKEREERAGL